MMLFRAAPRVALPEYIWGFLNSRIVQHQISARTAGSASPHLNVQDIKALNVVIPPLELQEDFRSRVMDVNELQAGHGEAGELLERLYKSLAERAFIGDL
jgi:type I restriction enzyme S subunit